MFWFELIGVLGTGLLAGSFLNLVSDRIFRNENFISGRSRCEFCEKELEILDLIPVFSYLLSKGRCRHCKKKLSSIYPLSELFTGIVFGIIYYYLSKNNLSWEYYLFYYVNFSILTIVFLYDYKFYEIPFNLIIFGSLFSLISRTIFLKNLNLENITYEVALWLGIFLFYFFVIWISKGGMGGGDLKLSVYIGIFLGFPASLFAIYYGFVVGGIFALILLILKKKGLKAKIPFGPFLVIGTLVSLLFQV